MRWDDNENKIRSCHSSKHGKLTCWRLRCSRKICDLHIHQSHFTSAFQHEWFWDVFFWGLYITCAHQVLRVGKQKNAHTKRLGGATAETTVSHTLFPCHEFKQHFFEIFFCFVSLTPEFIPVILKCQIIRNIKMFRSSMTSI